MTTATKSNGNGEAIQKAASNDLAAPQATVSERFLADVERQFLAQMGRGVQFTPFEQRLVQHVFLAVDQALKNAEARRKNGAEFTWKTIDRQKLALDTVHRVSLGLDALIPNHLWPIFYWNNHKSLYDVDLRIGYIGRDLVVRRFAMEPPVDITYELVYETDHFKALPRSASREVEGYDFEITQPFERGKIVGGFGYIVHDDPRKNRLILVTPRDFKRAKAASKSNFWADNDVEMHLKTIYHRVAAKIPLDPAKVNANVLASILEEDRDVVAVAHEDVELEAAQLANRQTIDIDPAPAPSDEDREPASATEATMFDEPEPEPAQAPF